MHKHKKTDAAQPDGAKRVTLRCPAPAAEAVFAAGTFNDWRTDATPLTRNGEGVWEATIDLAPGRYEFKFVVDGEWVCEDGGGGADFGCPECVPNCFGTLNRVLEVR